MDVLGENINKINSVAIFLSENINGIYHNLEAQFFIKKMAEKNKTIIPVYLKGYRKIPNNLAFIITLEAVDFREEDSDPLNHLINSIHQV